MATSASFPVTLSVAGSDCSSGAGLQADLKTFSAFRTYGLTVVTCVVSEVPGKVNRIALIDPEMVADQLALLLEGFPVAALKTGMLHSQAVIRQVAALLCQIPVARRPKLVVDPVMVATSGDPLIEPDAIGAYEELLFPIAEVITPNLDEAAVLLKRKLTRETDLAPAAESLHSRYGCAVLLKGGHLRGKTAVDVLRDQRGFTWHRAPFVPGISTHGTGCTYSAAITAALAKGEPLRTAVRQAKKFVSAAIAQSFRWGSGRRRIDALNHLQRMQ
ncbi:MAG: bifunctional hydroxymethylpyrimidine kinase/phosphomethylpyrimidine kinase [Verrucomicrobiales bacterium]|nr:bifunctional hydroxymethylpyrimidine kinase/phosphomethylpyrimidine kinase [Verrucomicrobiales bacterium]